MKRIVFIFTLIVGSMSLPVYANPPRHLTGTWRITLTGGDLQSLAYEPWQNILWEFNPLPDGRYDFNTYAFGWNGRPYRTTSQWVDREPPSAGGISLHTSVSEPGGNVIQVIYQVYFNFATRTVQGRYDKWITLGFTGFTSHHYGWVNGFRISTELTSPPEPVPQAPSGSGKEEDGFDPQYKACAKCAAEHRRACTWARDVNRPAKERERWQKICVSECKACEGEGC